MIKNYEEIVVFLEELANGSLNDLTIMSKANRLLKELMEDDNND
jgi:hypothetical protein